MGRKINVRARGERSEAKPDVAARCSGLSWQQSHAT